MVISAREETQNSCDRVCYCFNRDCRQPENFLEAQVCASCGSNLLLKNRYRALQLIGYGGFGRTFKGVDESQSSQPYCAIKQFWVHPNSPTVDKAIALFNQEAQRLEALGTNPSIPTLHDHFAEEGGQYLVQAFVSGRNLSQELAVEGLWNETSIRQLLLDLLPLLQFVHSCHVIHRDIKPENIIRCDRDGSLVLVDFGAAKVVTETTLEKTGTVIGSAAYTAPEQIRGKAIFASDIYSLGVTCIHLLTQVPPFDLFDSSENTWQWRHCLTQPVSESLGTILDKMLAGATNKRYQSATAVLKDLQSKPTRSTGRILLATGAALVFSLMGLEAVLSVARQVSPVPSQQETVSQSASNYESGGLYSYSDGGAVQTFPLQHTEVSANIAGNLSRVEVKQTFTNPYDEPLEAIYKFPLPEDAAVDDMEIRIGDRVIRGLIKEKEKAQEIYQEAKREGKTAGLLEQQRDNIFKQSLANIQPGEQIDVVIRYTNSLQFLGNEYEFVFPMVVAPRYESGTTVSQNRFTWGAPAWASDVGTRSGHDIDVTVDIDAGVALSKVHSPSHPITLQESGASTRVVLADQDVIPNKDLILRYQVMGAETQATVLTQANQQGGHFATYLIPAVEYNAEQIVPKDVVFLIDTSRSQAGAAIEQSRELMRQFISGLHEDDTFNIINFSDSATKLAEKPLANTRENRSKALNYISQLDADGGTELMNGVNTVLDFPKAADGRLRSIVLLSDGLIGDDEAIVGRIRDQLQPGNRLYSFGVGASTNRFLLNRLAELGRGTVTILPPDEDAVDVAEKFFSEINNPVVTNIEVDWVGEGEAPEIYPQRLPDLFASQPLVLYGRKQDGSSGQLHITGTVAGGQSYEKVLDVDFQQVRGNGAIAQLWGRSRIKDLMNQMYIRETPEIIQAVTETALGYRLLSKYTSFVAVTDEVRVDPGDAQLSEEVPAETPEGMVPYFGPSRSIPEPSGLVGNLIAGLLMVIYFTRKRWYSFARAMLKKIS